jgi:CubicO group peptidase (beta-lactamase class C family)
MALEESVRRLSAVVPNRAPGSTFEYANANYIILGLLVQVVSGRPSGLVQSHWRNR